MPIKPEKRALYPANWGEISARIRKRANGRCECIGECGLHQPRPARLCDPSRHIRDGTTPRRCLELHGTPARWARGKVVLTVHHLDFDPRNCDPKNLRAMCQRCHLRCDTAHHQRNAAETRRQKRQNLEIPL